MRILITITSNTSSGVISLIQLMSNNSNFV